MLPSRSRFAPVLSCTALLATIVALNGCIGVTATIKNHYTISTFQTKAIAHRASLPPLYIATPEAMASLETEQMLYTKVRFETKPFVHNAWSSTPSDMLYPLIVQSLEGTHAFKILAAGSHSESFHYRLGTEIIKLEQNFLTKPSQVQMIISAIVSDSVTGKPVASKLFRYNVPCPYDAPYGAAIAANRASGQFTKDLSLFVVTAVSHHMQVAPDPH